MQTFCKEERLTGKLFFDELMLHGKSVTAYPVKVVWVEKKFDTKYPAKAAFTAPKRMFKKAVDRNKLKRRMREVYRKNKASFYQNIADKKLLLLFIYVGKEIADYTIIEKSIIKTLTKIGNH